MKKLRITGVYNSEIISQLKSQDITEVGFDIRPRSFNFIQLEGIKNIMKDVPPSNLNYFMRFENDRDFVVKELVEKVNSFGLKSDSNLWPEFWGDETPEYCESIKIPYFKLLRDKDYKKWLSGKYIRGIILDEMFLNSLGVHADMLSFLGNLFDETQGKIKVDLSLDWNSQIPKSILEFYPFNCVSFQVDEKVENSYRNVNLQLIKQHIEHTQKLLSNI